MHSTHLRLPHHLTPFPNPFDKNELLALRLLVVRVLHAHVRIGRFVVVEELTQFGKAACANLREEQLVGTIRLGGGLHEVVS